MLTGCLDDDDGADVDVGAFSTVSEMRVLVSETPPKGGEAQESCACQKRPIYKLTVQSSAARFQLVDLFFFLCASNTLPYCTEGAVD